MSEVRRTSLRKAGRCNIIFYMLIGSIDAVGVAAQVYTDDLLCVRFLTALLCTFHDF